MNLHFKHHFEIQDCVVCKPGYVQPPMKISPKKTHCCITTSIQTGATFYSTRLSTVQFAQGLKANYIKLNLWRKPVKTGEF